MQIIFAALALTGACPAQATLDLARADVSHLPNGLTVIMLEDHSFPLVSVQMLYKSGSAAETTGKTGLAHFLEHLAFRGSQKFPNARATELIYDAGGEWHGYTAMDQTTYFATMPREGLRLLLEIEADRMARTIIDPAAIDAEKGAVVTELHGYENDPASVLSETVTRTALQVHPYGSPMAGYVGDVQRLTIDDARSYYASHYAPGNAVLAIAGDFSTRDVKALVAKIFADVPPRPVAVPAFAAEPPQRGERRTEMRGPVTRRYFEIAYPSPAASSSDFAAFMVLQEILSGGSGLNLRQSDWAGTASAAGSLIFGVADDVATWLPPTRDAFLFTVSGSIDAQADSKALERLIESRIAQLRDKPISSPRLAQAKAAVTRAISGDVLTTEDAAHQLAFFEGIGALDILLSSPQRISSVTATDVQRVARAYLAPDRRTIGWMVPGEPSPTPTAAGNPRASRERPGSPSSSAPVPAPQLHILASGLPVIIQQSGLSDSVTSELLLSAPVEGGAHPDELPGLDAIMRTGQPSELGHLVTHSLAAARTGPARAAPRSDEPASRLEQLISSKMRTPVNHPAAPLALVVSGDIAPTAVIGILERQMRDVQPAKRTASSSRPAFKELKVIRERIAKPLAQGAIGYVVEGPAPGTRQALAWRMLLYVLTHDYSGRLGRTAIADKGIVYHIYSQFRTDGSRSWTTISTGVDPEKSDAMEGELRLQLKKLVSEPPTQAELEAARNHLLGRDLTAAQSNEELAAKLTRQFVETGGVQSREQLVGQLHQIGPSDLAAAAAEFGRGTIIRVDVGPGR